MVTTINHRKYKCVLASDWLKHYLDGIMLCALNQNMSLAQLFFCQWTQTLVLASKASQALCTRTRSRCQVLKCFDKTWKKRI